MKAAANGIRRVGAGAGRQVPRISCSPMRTCRRLCSSASRNCFSNSGQSCDAPTRLLVESSVYEEAVSLAGRFAAAAKSRRSATAGRPYRPAGQRPSVRAGAGPYPQGHRGRRPRRDRRARQAEGLRERLLRQADPVRGCHQRHAYRPERNLRPGAGDDSVRRRG